MIDTFDAVDGWKAMPADGVQMKLSTDSGVTGKSLRIDFAFVKGGGYAVLHRAVALDLPENYRFTYQLRGDCAPNNLEFKLVDSTGTNVWWLNRRDVVFPHDWQIQTVKRRHLSFAWGPAGGGDLHHVAAIEFAITAGSGGAGTVWLDDLTLTPLPPPPATWPAIDVAASSRRAGHPASFAADEDTSTAWASAPGDPTPSLTLDLGVAREFGGLAVAWAPGQRAGDYLVETSLDADRWRVERAVRGGGHATDYLSLPESEARWIRFRMIKAESAPDVSVREIRLEPLDWGASRERLYATIAADAPRGAFPRGIRGEQSYWTVVGSDDGDGDPGLLSEDGALELRMGGPSLEPFLRVDGRLVTWADARIEQRLLGIGGTGGASGPKAGGPNPDDGDWPIPQVVWHAHGVDLTVTALAIGDTAHVTGAARALAGARPRRVVRYHVRNTESHATTVSLWLAIRPFQVDPPSQTLNHPGGVASIRDIAGAGGIVALDGVPVIASVTDPTDFGACAYDQGDAWEFLRDGRVPRDSVVRDVQSLASGLMVYRLDLPPGGERDVSLVITSHEPSPQFHAMSEATVDDAVRFVARRWESHRRGMVFGPAAATAASGHSNAVGGASRGASGPAPTPRALTSIWPALGDALAERDGPAIRPGTRSYARAWIRDGALASAALLRLGHPEAVRAFIEWYATRQYDNGKVPCCVDARGADPVPEHDSDGEFIYLVAEYERFTHDRAFAARLWPRIHAAAAYLDSLRNQRRGAAWRSGTARMFYGLLPPSISHEGYSAQPMHSYWDDLWALRGFEDAEYLANRVGKGSERSRWSHAAHDFGRDLVASIEASMNAHGIDYVPGCADLGDFDATSTTIALSPVEADDLLPRAALTATFERYWDFFKQRRAGVRAWDAYTPYELRSVGAFVRLGWRDRAQEVLSWLMDGQRPPGWRQWPEVVWHDARAPHFLGDLPHAWVGTDYLRSVLDMLAYTRERDERIVLGAGVATDWIQGDGLRVQGLHTPYGALGYTMRARGRDVETRIDAGVAVPHGGIVVNPPATAPFRRATINGATAAVRPDGTVLVSKLPATVVMRP